MLLAADTLAARTGFDSTFAEAEDAGGQGVRVEEVRISSPHAGSLEIVFSTSVSIESAINDGSIVSAMSLNHVSHGPIDLSAGQFVYEDSVRTLTWSSRVSLAPGYHELNLDGALFQDDDGRLLLGGTGGFVFAPPTLGSARDTFASGTAIAMDSFSVPLLADWNADQLADLIVGEKTSVGEGKIRVYLNVGTSAAPAYEAFFYAQQGGADLSVSANGCLGVFPRVHDWDDDGGQDLLLGLADGTVQLYLNVNTGTNPEFAEPSFLQVGEPGAKTNVDVGARATFDIVDWNNDGRKDLVLGALDGRVRILLDEVESGPADFRREIVLQDGAMDLIAPSTRSSVAVVDLNKDGRKDLVLGNTEGQLLFYANVGTDATPHFDGWEALIAGGEEIDIEGSPRSRPFVGDFNADGMPDFLVGAQDGLVRRYESESWESPTNVPIDSGAPGGMFVFTFQVPQPPWMNSANPLDITGDGQVLAEDALHIIHELNHPTIHDADGKLRMPTSNTPPLYFDVTGDGYVSPVDALRVINFLNRVSRVTPAPLQADPEGEPADDDTLPSREVASRPNPIIQLPTHELTGALLASDDTFAPANVDSILRDIAEDLTRLAAPTVNDFARK